jgi:hypothetical protein
MLAHLIAFFRVTAEIIRDAFEMRARLQRRYGTTD